MSVIAWDGKTLASDKKSIRGDVLQKVTKIVQLPDGTVLAWCGQHEQGLRLRQWYADGAIAENRPVFADKDEWTRMIVAKPDGSVCMYEQEPVAQYVEEPFQAWGSGAEYALGAMAMGANARQAVEIAGRFSATCGLGVDAFDVLTN